MADVNTPDRIEEIKILYVDDDESFLSLSKQILLDMNSHFLIETASCTDEALEKLGKQEFHVIVSDYSMPIKNGLDFLRELKEKSINLPFILFTGKGREEVAIQALNLGAEGYFNKQGNPVTVYGELVHGIVTVAEKRKTELALDESEKRCQTIMNQAREMIFIHDSDGKFVYVNPQATQNLGYSTKEFYHMNVIDIDRNASKDSLGALWPKVLAGETFTFETTHKRKNGSVYPTEVSISAVNMDGEKLVMGFARDISEKRKIEERLKESEERYRGIVELSPYGIAFANLAGKILMVNKAFSDLSGYPKEEIVGKHFTQLKTLRPTDLPKFMKLFLNFLKDKKASSVEFVYIKKDGSRHDAEARFALVESNGKKTGIQIILNDITEQKNNQRSIKRPENRLRKAITLA